ncbi:MAG: hypothetical protein NTY12_02780 [Candidatus Falkowbacteria bacterium]|nr:hypothetical protein [Candidatus Falkowbacteria bacterium]
MTKEIISQEKPKSKQESIGELNFAMEALADEAEARYGVRLLNSDGSANSEVFGSLSEEDVRFINNRINYWAGADSPDARATFAKFHNLGDPEQLDEEELKKTMVDYWHKNTQTGNGAIFEMMVTVIFRKALGEDYLVMRSSKRDDYQNGVDNIIINTKTNEVICAFDEVQEPTLVGKRLGNKNIKIIDIAVKGGQSIKDGVKFINGNVEKASYNNLPVFYISSDPDQLKKDLQKINAKDINNATDFEHELFVKFASTIIQQAEMLLQLESVPQKVKDRLKKVSAFFNDRK